MANDDEGSVALTVAKGALMVLGGLVVFGVATALFAPIFKVGILGALGLAAGYFGYRAVSGRAALPAGKAPKALGSDRDFDRKMRELEAMERRLDDEIRRGS